MKTLSTLFIFNLSFIIFNCAAQWVELETGMENPPVFNDVYAITPDIVVVVGANGTILKTTDGGETWQQKPSGINQSLHKVQFLTPEIGYAIGSGWKFLKTIDGGETWSLIDTGTDCSPHIFSCVDENLIFIGCGSNLFKSYDGGENWELSGILSIAQEMQFLNEELGFVLGEWNSVYRTTNGGENWQELNFAHPIYFIDHSIGFYYESGLYKTIDGGENFEYLGTGIGGEDLSKITAINEQNVWGIFAGVLNGDGTTQGILKVGAEPYTEIYWVDNNPEIDMYSIHFADETTGYVVGIKNGEATIWKNGTGINTMNTIEESKKEFKAYPNPATNQINVSFAENFSGMIALTDLTGKQIYSSSFTNKNNIVIDLTSFPKGIYMLTAKNKQENYSQKIIINQ